MSHPIKVAISHGDTNGIGYELIIKTFANPEIFELCTPIVYGSPHLMTYYNKLLGTHTNFYQIKNAREAKAGVLNMVVVAEKEIKVSPGQISREAGYAAALSLTAAATAVKQGEADVLVTAPVHKDAIHSEHFPYVGQTEYLNAVWGEPGKDNALMVLFTEHIRVALATTHLPLREVANHITGDGLHNKIDHFLHSLQHDFLLPVSKLAVLGLNPHNGDGGTIGEEEEHIIKPLIQQYMEAGKHVFGPFAADGFFGAAHYRAFDGILAMYHDQGLAPFKTLGMKNGVNFTAGLPFVRTSPDHGTAFEIAGKGVADISSFRQAIFAAIDIFRNRKVDNEAHANILPKLYQDQREETRVHNRPESQDNAQKGEDA